jgi:hypothetical protein
MVKLWKRNLMKHIWKWLVCVLWQGQHDYVVVTPEDFHGRQLAVCRRCGHHHVGIFWGDAPIEKFIKSKRNYPF